jgi:hypothetical protein
MVFIDWKTVSKDANFPVDSQKPPNFKCSFAELDGSILKFVSIIAKTGQDE